MTLFVVLIEVSEPSALKGSHKPIDNRDRYAPLRSHTISAVLVAELGRITEERNIGLRCFHPWVDELEIVVAMEGLALYERYIHIHIHTYILAKHKERCQH